MPAVVAYGFCVSIAGIASQTLVQLASDRNMRGRVMALYGLIFRGGPAIGALGAGILSVQLGLRWPVVIGAVLLVVAWLWTYLIRRRIASHAGGTAGHQAERPSRAMPATPAPPRA